MTDCCLGREQKCLSMRRFLTLYMTVNWHREFAVNFATFLKVCCDFFTFAPWFSYSPNHVVIQLNGIKMHWRKTYSCATSTQQSGKQLHKIDHCGEAPASQEYPISNSNASQT